jgi:DNA polymerase III subunit epsilon
VVSPFGNSMFSQMIGRNSAVQEAPKAILGGVTGSRFALSTSIHSVPLVIFDFETTGLDTKHDRIIEIGAVKFQGRQEVARFDQLVHPGRTISQEITQVTGITNEMLLGQPPIEDVLPAFHDFLRGCVGVAHNAEFDTKMMISESYRLGIQCDYFIVCTLKMARELVKIERRNLDSLAAHYNLTFESRHRSIGDILVTAGVLWNMLEENSHLVTLKDFSPYQEVMTIT